MKTPHTTSPFKRAAEGEISINHVSKVYDPEGINLCALNDCSLKVEPGEFLVLVGPSGCGKTTLLNAIAGFENITEGSICLDRKLISAPGLKQSPGSDRIVVFQDGALFPWKTVLENLTFGPVVQKKMPKAKAVAEARRMMDRLGLSRDTEHLYPEELSSGMKRQVEIIRAIINDPKVLLLDEPFRAVESTTKGLMHEYLLELYEITKKTIFFITHDLDEAIFLADRIAIMTTRPGRIKTVIAVDIPRPRDLHVLATAQFAAIKRQALKAVREETLKAFEAGERELA